MDHTFKLIYDKKDRLNADLARISNLITRFEEQVEVVKDADERVNQEFLASMGELKVVGNDSFQGAARRIRPPNSSLEQLNFLLTRLKFKEETLKRDLEGLNTLSRKLKEAIGDAST